MFVLALLCAVWTPTASQIGKGFTSSSRHPVLRCINLRIVTIVATTRTVFVTEPEDVFAAVGSPALFNCSVTASNPVSITWLKDGAAVTPGPRFSYLANNSLLIESVQQEDDGEYSCRVTDSITQEAVERSSTLTVACETASSTVLLVCVCVCGGGGGGGGDKISHSQLCGEYSTMLPFVLHVHFTVILSSLLFILSHSPSSLSLSLFSSPFPDILDSFVLSPNDATVNEGNLLQLFCIHGGSVPAAGITWTLNNDVIMTSSRITIVSQPLAGSDPPRTSSSLYITSAVPSDAGSYRCVASNQHLPGTTVTSAEGTVTIIGESMRNHATLPSAPLFFLPPSPLSATTMAHLCPTYTSPLSATTMAHLCPTYTSPLSATTMAHLCPTCTSPSSGVPRPPNITQHPANTVVAPSNTAMFTCSAEGQPLPTFAWSHDGVQLDSEQASIQSSGGSSSLTLTGVTSAEEGLYACTASNSEGSATSSSAQLQLACECVSCELVERGGGRRGGRRGERGREGLW